MTTAHLPWSARRWADVVARLAPSRWPLLLAIVAAGMFAVAVRAFHSEAVTYTAPRVKLSQTSASVGIPDLRDAEFQIDGTKRIRAWFVPAKNGATVVMLHGSTANREQLVPEARALAGAGFGVVMYDSPGQGESDGTVQCGAIERRALTAAVEWAEHRADVDPHRLGLFGFSLGGYIAIQVAARDARVRAIAVAGALSDWKRVTRWEFRRWGVISEWPAVLADRLFGGPTEELEPLALVARIAPRPLLFVQGGADTTVPGFSADELYSAAGANKERYLVLGAEHGEYMHVAPDEYPRRLIDFYARSLLR